MDSRVACSAWSACPRADQSVRRAWNQTQRHAAEGCEKEMDGNRGKFGKNISRHTAHFQIGHDRNSGYKVVKQVLRAHFCPK